MKEQEADKDQKDKKYRIDEIEKVWEKEFSSLRKSSEHKIIFFDKVAFLSISIIGSTIPVLVFLSESERPVDEYKICYLIGCAFLLISSGASLVFRYFKPEHLVSILEDEHWVKILHFHTIYGGLKNYNDLVTKISKAKKKLKFIKKLLICIQILALTTFMLGVLATSAYFLSHIFDF